MEKLATGFGFLEAPAWDEGDGALLFADPALGGIWRLALDGSVSCPYPHRKGIGGMAVHADGGVIVAGRNLAWKCGDITEALADIPPDAGLTRFNDLTVDPAGRVYVGSIDMNPTGDPPTRNPGFLHLFDVDGSEQILADGVLVSNGMKVSAGGTRLFHGDTGRNTVWAYDRAEDGGLANRRALIEWPDRGPDGMAQAEDGTLFIALVGSRTGEIGVVSPEGKELDRLPVPQPATSLCFGGPEMRTLYVVTGGDHSGRDRNASVYAEEMPVRGLPVPLARVRARS